MSLNWVTDLKQEASGGLFHTFETSPVRNPQSFDVKGDTEVFLS